MLLQQIRFQNVYILRSQVLPMQEIKLNAILQCYVFFIITLLKTLHFHTLVF